VTKMWNFTDSRPWREKRAHRDTELYLEPTLPLAFSKLSRPGRPSSSPAT